MLINKIPDEMGMSTFDFDSVTGLIFGVGLTTDSKGNYVRALVTLDSATTLFNLVGYVPYNYFLIDDAESAIDVTNRRLFVFLNNQTSAAPTTTAWKRMYGAASSSVVDAEEPNAKKTTTPAPPQIPSMNLVAISLNTADVLSSPLACKEFSECPWNIQYLA